VRRREGTGEKRKTKRKLGVPKKERRGCRVGIGQGVKCIGGTKRG